jgi:anti-anti-sigma regulatory factor
MLSVLVLVLLLFFINVPAEENQTGYLTGVGIACDVVVAPHSLGAAQHCGVRTAPLFFANAEFFKAGVLEAAAKSPAPLHWLVVAAESVTSVDVTAADSLAELDDALHKAGTELCFAELKDPVKDKLKRFGLFSRFGENAFFPTIGAAVSSYLESHQVD